MEYNTGFPHYPKVEHPMKPLLSQSGVKKGRNYHYYKWKHFLAFSGQKS